jgi:putative ABC transport system permease protein
MTPRPDPPRLPRELLLRALPPEDRDAVVGDLDEEFRRTSTLTVSPGRASRWYWRQAILSLPAAIRLRRRAARRTAWTADRSAGARFTRDLGQDGRYALRLFRRQPGFVALTVLTHALGIALTTAVATIAYGVLLRPLPYAEPDRLYQVYEADRSRQDRPGALSYPDFLVLRERSRAFEQVAGYSGGSRTLTGAGPAERVSITEVTDGFFETLGVRPLLGRTFDRTDINDGSARVVILGHGAWQRRFGGDPTIVGRAIAVNGQAHTVVGVLPADFAFPLRGLTELWLPLVPSRAQVERRYWHWLDAIGRRAPGATGEQVRSDLDGIARDLAVGDPRWHTDANVGYGPLRDQIVQAVRPALLVVLVAVALMLVAACASVAGLLIARWSSRAHEMGLRAAIGANPLRLVRQLLAESLLLAGAGGVAGVLAGHWLMRLFVSSVPRQYRAALPHLDSLSLDPTAALCAISLSVATGLVVGVAPAIAAARTSPADSLRRAGRSWAPAGQGSARFVLVAAQVALAVVLLTGAALLGRSTWRLLNVSPGFNPVSLLTMRVNLPGGKYNDLSAVRQFRSRLLEGLSALPGTTGVATIDQLPLTGRGNTASVIFEDEPGGTNDPSRIVAIRTISANYPDVMGVPVIRGRSFGPEDGLATTPVVLVNRDFAQRLSRGRDVIGQRIIFEFLAGRPRWEIVGVVGDEQFDGLDKTLVPVVYFPYAQNAAGEFNVVLRTTTDPAPFVMASRAVAGAIDPAIPLFLMRTMDEIVAQSEAVFLRRQVLALLALFGAAALVVSTLGLYGVLAQLVVQRRREIGVRMALGAASRDIVRLVLGQGLAPAVAGMLVGLGLSLAGSRFARSLLFEVSPSDPLSITAVCVLLLGVAALAGLVPAWRAVRIDPVTALKSD